MIVQPSAEQIANEEAQAWQQKEFNAQQEAIRREHEYRLAKLKLATKPRRQAIERVALAIFKLPAVCILCIVLPIVTLRGTEVPQFYVDFMTL